MSSPIEILRNGMIVSCQSEGNDPFNASPQSMGLFARAAEMGGAVGIRTEGIEKLKAIKAITRIPVIGLIKDKFPDGTVKITGSFSDVERLCDAGCDIIAIDGTFRQRENLTGPDFIAETKRRYGCIVLADIATEAEAKACEQSGADAVSTTLQGYTPDTMPSSDMPAFDLLERLVQKLKIPVFAEGRYNTPQMAEQAMRIGAYAVITGTAITRPRIVTQWFVEAVTKGVAQRYDNNQK